MTTLVGIADYLKNLMDTNKAALGIKEVHYGDVDSISSSLVVCVEPDFKTTEWRTMPAGVTRIVNVFVLVYYGTVTNPSKNRRDCDIMAETIEGIIHQDRTFGGLVQNALVAQVASGFARKDGILIRSSRLMVTATFYENLPMT